MYLDIMYVAQAGTIQSAGCVRLDINLLKPSRLEFQDQDIAPDVALPLGHRLCSSPTWLEYVYRTSHPWISSRVSGPRGSVSKKGILNLLGQEPAPAFLLFTIL